MVMGERRMVQCAHVLGQSYIDLEMLYYVTDD